jgi:hypothetical protein
MEVKLPHCLKICAPKRERKRNSKEVGRIRA